MQMRLAVSPAPLPPRYWTGAVMELKSHHLFGDLLADKLVDSADAIRSLSEWSAGVAVDSEKGKKGEKLRARQLGTGKPINSNFRHSVYKPVYKHPVYKPNRQIGSAPASERPNPKSFYVYSFSAVDGEVSDVETESEGTSSASTEDEDNDGVPPQEAPALEPLQFASVDSTASVEQVPQSWGWKVVMLLKFGFILALAFASLYEYGRAVLF
ncbi:hypothetical protein B0H11DRAFT_1936116 [Mycena galericulata]|nr:hypothetical protein B0H11DRAFT_1936116 [Mycena galericulata]